MIELGGAKEKMKNFNRNLKAISPIFATLILIAIAVIAGVVVYMFTSGTLATMTGGGTAAQEKVSVQAASGAGTGITVYAQNTAGGTVNIASMIVKTSSGTVYGVNATAVSPTTLTSGLQTLTTTLNTSLIAGNSYTVTIVSANGGNFISSSFVAT
jgi:archaeal type IV pilus assembly protein PilA